MDEVEKYFFTTKDPQTGLPAITTLLYDICNQNNDKFNEACRLIRLFIEKAQEDLK